ncbi:hypothetical protein AMATHDRAFT_7055 [Amanita thiersii Skay4041]|uniref:Uncharacterized protein n=1 Tax=Amanita thiersii Skay4041 TaxID=703135 RepID=A0A2A9N8M4_9AGAR|nr:hypothetical protein AMATHDRAFT_7055 [Amanita thiersii Skay4041]
MAHRSAPASPESIGSPLTGSLYYATHAIDDLTSTLANFSDRIPSPDVPVRLVCCCEKEDCENLSHWLEAKSRLESRLRLSAGESFYMAWLEPPPLFLEPCNVGLGAFNLLALCFQEVGQALLQRHEAYIRRHEASPRKPEFLSRSKSTDSAADDMSRRGEETDKYVSELLKENALLEKRLNQALINNEVSEVSTKSILQELEEARTTISRLTANQARSAGWDVRLSAALKERDDIQQERDAESQRARLAESRFAALKEKAAKLQVEVRRLQESLDSKRAGRLESSESTLQDARTQIQLMHSGGYLGVAEHDELTRILELLVNDNEGLKRDNAELQKLLADCREDFHVLQEEVEEQRANPQVMSSLALKHKHSRATSLSKDFQLYRRSASNERHTHVFEPLTPETNRRPLSPTTFVSTPSEPRWTATTAAGSHHHYAPSHHSYELDHDVLSEEDIPEKAGHKLSFSDLHPQPLHQTRNTGVQTDGTWHVYGQQRVGLRHPAMLSVPSPVLNGDPRSSESSSYSSETLASHLSTLLDRMSSLFTRLSQADALTLTNRLKRQHLYHNASDVKHLSRSTINQVLSDLTLLRSQFRVLLEDDKVITVCTRKEVRVLFKLVKDMFNEMGELRGTLNDVVLDPLSASKVSEYALDPSKAEKETLREENGHRGFGGKEGTMGWINPISKLFSPGQRVEKHHAQSSYAASVIDDRGSVMNRTVSGRGMPRPVRNITVPKIGPALAATATTVNVEFSGATVGRSVTNTFSNVSHDLPIPVSVAVKERHTNGNGNDGLHAAGAGAGSTVMDIFAGAPMRQPGALTLEPEPWVVLPKAPRRIQSSIIQITRSSSRMGYRARTGSSTPTMDGTDAQSIINTSTLGIKETMSTVAGGLSRCVDAVIDHQGTIGSGMARRMWLGGVQPEGESGGGGGEGTGEAKHDERGPPQPDRSPLLRRGLSDSSIHSTFTSHGNTGEEISIRVPTLAPTAPVPGIAAAAGSSGGGGGGGGGGVAVVGPSRQLRWPDRQSVLQALSRTVQNFRIGGAGVASSMTGGAAAGSKEGITTVAGKSKTGGDDPATAVPSEGQSSQNHTQAEPPPSPIVAEPKLTSPTLRSQPVQMKRPDTNNSSRPHTSNMVIGSPSSRAMPISTLLSAPPVRDPFIVGSVSEGSLLQRTYYRSGVGGGAGHEFV